MAGGRKDVLDIRELVRHLKLGRGIRAIARDLGVHRSTVRDYLTIAKAEGWLAKPELPSLAEIDAAVVKRTPVPAVGPASSVEKHREKVVRLRQQGVEVMAIWQILRDEDQFTGSYASVLRFVHRLEPKPPGGCLRIEVPPGSEAQVDFGYAGEFVDPATGKLRRTWVFVMTLSHSRHQYCELVFDQTVATWLACQVHAFEFLGGVVGKVVIDNLKAAITKACYHDPDVQRSYREFAIHYDFIIGPCPVETPEHKGKVENGVHYVKRNALAGRTFRDVHEGNEYLRHWVMTRAGRRDHGTTHQQPLARFEAVEKAALKPLPETRYELAVFKQVKLHPDCHVVFEKAYYSAPHRLIGQTLWLRATKDRVELYYANERVATHPRALEPGKRITNHAHYPPDKLAWAMVTPVRLREAAEKIGPATLQFVSEMLSDNVERLRGAQGVLNFAKKYGEKRLEAACRRALFVNAVHYRTVESILRRGLDATPLPAEVQSPGPVPKRAAFARSVHEIAAHLWRKTWS